MKIQKEFLFPQIKLAGRIGYIAYTQLNDDLDLQLIALTHNSNISNKMKVEMYASQ